eukprot:3859571-Prymnesium_polylepis.1
MCDSGSCIKGGAGGQVAAMCESGSCIKGGAIPPAAAVDECAEDVCGGLVVLQRDLGLDHVIELRRGREQLPY